MTISKKHALVWGCFFLAVVALVLHVEQIYFMATVLGLLAPASYLLSRHRISGLQARRRCPSQMYAGDTARVSVEIINTAITPRSLFEVRDTIPKGLSISPGEPHLVVDLPGGQTTAVTYSLVPLRRGLYRLGPVRFVARDTLGIYEFSAVADVYNEIVVYPKPVSLPDLWPETVEAVLQRQRRYVVGEGIDFHSVREYVPGDDLRRISWTNTARRGKLVVVESRQQTAHATTIILDLSRNVHAGQGERSSLEYGVVLAASLAEQGGREGAAIGLIAVGANDYSVPVSAAPGQQAAVFDALARCRDDCPHSLREVITSRGSMLPRGGRVAVISPQVGAELVDVAAYLALQGNTVLWFLLQTLTFGPENKEIGNQRNSREAHFAAALRQAGVQCYLVSGIVPLESNFWRWTHAVS